MAAAGQELALEATADDNENSATENVIQVIKRFMFKSVGWFAIYMVGYYNFSVGKIRMIQNDTVTEGSVNEEHKMESICIFFKMLLLNSSVAFHPFAFVCAEISMEGRQKSQIGSCQRGSAYR